MVGSEKHWELILRYLSASWRWGREHGAYELERASRDRLEFDEPTPRDRDRGPIPVEAIDWMNGRKELAGKWDRSLDKLVQGIVSEGMESGATLKESIKALEAVFPDFSKARLENIARTEASSAYTRGRLDWFTAPDSRVGGIQYSSILDERTTDICKSRDGLIMAIDDPRLFQNTPPLHYQCRATLVPIARSQWKRLLAGDPRLTEKFFGWVQGGGPKNAQQALAGWDGATPPLAGFGGSSPPIPAAEKPEKIKVTPPEVKEGKTEKKPKAKTGSMAKRIKEFRGGESRKLDDVMGLGKEIFAELDKGGKVSKMASTIATAGTHLSKLEAVCETFFDDFDALTKSMGERKFEAFRAEIRAERDSLKLSIDKSRTEFSSTVRDMLRGILGKSVVLGPSDAKTSRSRHEWRPVRRASEDSVREAIEANNEAIEMLPRKWLESSRSWGPIETTTVVRGSYYHYRKHRTKTAILETSGLSSSERVSTSLHEMAHRMEYIIPGLNTYSKAFLRARTDGEELKSLNDLLPEMGGGFMDHERAREDNFANPYMGKETGPNSSEVLTMSLEGLFFNTYDVWGKDPESVAFALGALAAF